MRIIEGEATLRKSSAAVVSLTLMEAHIPADHRRRHAHINSTGLTFVLLRGLREQFSIYRQVRAGPTPDAALPEVMR
jgi:hypothetical protein